MAELSPAELIRDFDRKSSTVLARDQRAKKSERQMVQFFNEMEKTDFDHEDIEADDEGDGNPGIMEDTDTRNPKLVKRDLIRRHRVLMIRVGYDSRSDDRYFWDCVNIIKLKTDDCLVYVNNIDRNKDSVKQFADKTSYFCRWLPETLNGYFRDPFYCIRSWVTGLSSYCSSKHFAPTLVFVDAHHITIPLVKMFFSCPVVTFGFFDEMLNRKKFAVIPSTASTTLEVVRNFCLSRSDELIVPSKATGAKFTQQTQSCPFSPTVLYPPVHGKAEVPVIMRTKYTFLIIGPWQKFARMEFALLASMRFYHNELQTSYKNRVQFVFIGFLDENDSNAKAYKDRMHRMFQEAEKPFRYRIAMYTNPTRMQLLSHYRNCVMVMNVTTCDFVWPLLEGVYFGKPVICLHNDFAEEIIANGINGYVLGTDLQIFAVHMNYLFMYVVDELPTCPAVRLARKFSHVGRKSVINELLLKYFPLTQEEKYD